MTKSLTLVIPCYREAARLEPARFLEFLDATEATRLLFVDDGSPDDTPTVLAELATRRPARIEVLTLAENVGKGEAVRRGLSAALDQPVELVGFWDADLATPLALVESFRATLSSRPDVAWVLGSRWRGLGRNIERDPVRHYLSRVFATVVSLMLGLPVYDTQCGAKVFRANPLLREVLSQPFLSRWIFDVEMLARLIREHRRGRAPEPCQILCELPLDRWRHDGRSHVRLGDFVVAFTDVWRIWRCYLREPASTRR
jgi:glycosyltransferase involved in cell wall biosynthesis